LAVANRAFETDPVGQASALGPGRWLVFHAGVIGGDASAGGEVRRQNDDLLGQVLRISAEANIQRLVLASSGAAGFAEDAPPAKAAYARMKRDHEATAQAWSKQTGVRLLVPRIFNLGGPHMTCAGNYALGDFILRLARDGRLEIRAASPVFRDYVHVMELAGALLDMAVDATEDGEPFDVGGTQIVELGELARQVAQSLGLRDAKITRPPTSDEPGDWYVGEGKRYQTALFKTGRSPTRLSTIVADAIEYLEGVKIELTGESS
jgi:nucleoside-diphosphate-sugar epimerase